MFRGDAKALFVLAGLVGCHGLPIASQGATHATASNSIDSLVNASAESTAQPTPARAADTPKRPQTGNPLWGIPLSSLSATRERPIFSPSRRPPAPTLVAASVPVLPPQLPTPTEPSQPLLTLVGTIVSDIDQIGVFLDQATRGIIRLKVRQEHAGWLLVAVQERQVMFEKGTRAATLTLPARGTEVVPSPPAQSMAAPSSAEDH